MLTITRWEIEDAYYLYLEECEEQGIDPEYKTVEEWWNAVE